MRAVDFGRWAGAVGLMCAVATGCGKGTETPSNTAGGLPTASITPAQAAGGRSAETDGIDPEFADPDLDADDGTAEAPAAPPREGTAEWYLHETMKLRLAAPPKTENIAELKKARAERNEKIIELAQQAISLTHNDPQRERLFVAAVTQLLDARVQMASTGDAEQAELLYSDVDALRKRDPKSAAAAQAAYTLLDFAYNSAGGNGRVDLKWMTEYSRLAIAFVKQFPREETRGLPMLFTAARSCELNGLVTEARDSYAALIKANPKSPYAAIAQGVLARMDVVGKTPRIQGSTLDGADVGIEDFAGKVCVVVFWSSNTRPENNLFPKLKEVARKHPKERLAFLGVCLDTDRGLADGSILAGKVGWPQIFHEEKEHQGANNPVAARYGILQTPALWLVDKEGKVVTTHLSPGMVDAAVTAVLSGQPWTPDAAAAAAEEAEFGFHDEEAVDALDADANQTTVGKPSQTKPGETKPSQTGKTNKKSQ
jgi:hypothetical protein